MRVAGTFFEADMVVEGLPEVRRERHSCTEHEVVKVVDDACYRRLALEVRRLQRRKIVIGVCRVEDGNEVAKGLTACCLI